MSEACLFNQLQPGMSLAFRNPYEGQLLGPSFPVRMCLKSIKFLRTVTTRRMDYNAGNTNTDHREV